MEHRALRLLAVSGTETTGPDPQGDRVIDLGLLFIGSDNSAAVEPR
jgi:hypothetical protein